MVTAYCMTCGRPDKEKGKNKEMKDPRVEKTARGGFMAKGACPDCGQTLCKIMSAATADATIASGEATKAY